MITIISILMGLLIPAVQSVRQSAQRASCLNNLKQIGLAMANFQSSQRRYPRAFDVPVGAIVRGSWSVHAQILPYMEEGNAHKQIDFNVDWHDQVDTGIPAYGVGIYSCPSEPMDRVRTKNGQPYVHPTNYGFNMGSWFIYDPQTGAAGDGAFRVNQTIRPKDIRDGVSNTLCASEVKAYTSYIRNVATIDPTLPDSTDFFEGVMGELKLGPQSDSNTGHTVWTDGRVHHTGFTTVFAPNTKVTFTSGSFEYDIDFNSQQEGRDLTRPTYAAVTARSHHFVGVNSLNLDGSVRLISDSIDLELWRALGTVAGSEINIAE